jgi:Flp pilus assembly secretin CpaC
MIASNRAAAVLFAVAVLAAPVLAPAAVAADDAPISVKANMARILRISAPAATVIIGNPGVADVTIQDPQTLVLTGKSYGQTNLIVLDSSGNPIADTLIEVVQSGQSDAITVYLGQARTTLSCAPQCQPMIMLGDDPAYTSNTLASSSVIESAAQ